MGQLAPARFKTNHKASGGLYAGQGYVDIAHKKIKDKREFILGTNAQGRKVYGLSFFEDKGGDFKKGTTNPIPSLFNKFLILHPSEVQYCEIESNKLTKSFTLML